RLTLFHYTTLFRSVDRVLHNRGNVSAEAEREVKKVLSKTSYTPDPIAKSLGTNKDFEIAVIMPHPEQDEYWELSEDGIEHARQEWKPYNVNIETESFDLNNPQSFARVSQKILDKNPDAVLTAPVYFDASLTFFQQLQKADIPFILFNTQIEKRVKKYDPLCFVGQNLYQSGRVAADLMKLLLAEPGNLAVMHIHEYIDNAMHLKEKEHGFRGYFDEFSEREYNIESFLLLDEEGPIEVQISQCLEQSNLKGIFVPTSSGTFATAQALKYKQQEEVILIGYDLLEQNIQFLESGVVNFLINQNPRYQAQQGVKYLVNHLLLDSKVPDADLLPLEIITRQNYRSFLDNNK